MTYVTNNKHPNINFFAWLYHLDLKRFYEIGLEKIIPLYM